MKRSFYFFFTAGAHKEIRYPGIDRGLISKNKRAEKSKVPAKSNPLLKNIQIHLIAKLKFTKHRF